MSGTRSQREVWDRHWRALGKESALFGTLAALVRKLVLRPAVAIYAETWFPPEGVFVDAGCGTGQASASIPVRGRHLVGFDFSLPALLSARTGGPYHLRIGGDIRALPFRDGSVAGL